MERSHRHVTRSVLFVWLAAALLTSCASAIAEAERTEPETTPRHDPPVTVFGAADTFGTLGNRLSTRQRVAKVEVPEFSTRPGQAFFFPAVASDGTLFVANMTQTYSELALTGCEMVITCFNPEQATCYDDRTGAPARFANLRIPAANGSLSTPPECPSGLRFDVPRVQGSEVDDLEVVVDEQQVERVVFDSFDGSVQAPPPPNHYPMFGSLRQQEGVWRVDPSSLRYPRDLADSSREGASACPKGDCGAVTEMARLPASNRLVINQYVGGSVLVVDLAGRVLGSYRVEPPHDWCDPTQHEPIVPSLRQVNPDPTSVLGDERFVVVFEGWGPTGQLAQEFSYDELEPDPSRRVRPITAPFHPDSPFHPAPSCGHGSTVLAAIYDDLGNLWLTAMDRDGAWRSTALVVVKHEGRRRLDDECSFLDPATGTPRPWGTVCQTDFDVGALTAGLPDVAWSFPSALNDPVLDPATRTMYAVLGDGKVYPIARKESGDGGFVFVAGDGLDPNSDQLAPLEPNAAHRQVARGAIDPVRRALWLPLAALVASDGLFSNFYVGQQLAQYLYRIDLDRAFDGGIEVRDVAAPTSAAAGADVGVSVRARLSPFRPELSFFALYPPGSSVPVATSGWSKSDCERGMCRFSTSVPGDASVDRPGVYAWHAGLYGGAVGAHLVGRLVVE